MSNYIIPMSKNHSMSKLVAKLLLRFLLITLLLSVVPFFADNNTAGSLEQVYLYMPNKWALIFPVLLFLSFLALMILVLQHKYSKTDLNWMFSLNAGLLIVYLLMLYVRIYPLLFS